MATGLNSIIDPEPIYEKILLTSRTSVTKRRKVPKFQEIVSEYVEKKQIRVLSVLIFPRDCDLQHCGRICVPGRSR